MSTLDPPVLIWMTLAIVAAIIEISVPHFGVLFVAVAGVATALAAFLSFGVPTQAAVFVVVLALSFFALRPRLLALLGARGVPSRIEAVLGRHGVVTEAIETTVGAGRVNVAGQDWAARATAPLAIGTKVRVVSADGIVLEVTPRMIPRASREDRVRGTDVLAARSERRGDAGVPRVHSLRARVRQRVRAFLTIPPVPMFRSTCLKNVCGRPSSGNVLRHSAERRSTRPFTLAPWDEAVGQDRPDRGNANDVAIALFSTEQLADLRGRWDHSAA